MLGADDDLVTRDMHDAVLGVPASARRHLRAVLQRGPESGPW